LAESPHLTAFQRFLRLLKGDRREVYYIYMYAIFAGIINLVLPLGIQAILNLIQGGAVSTSWWLLIGIVTLGTFLAGLLVVMQMTVSETLQRRIFTRVSFDFAERIPNLKTEAIRREHMPELVNRFFDTFNVQKGLPKLLIDLSTAVMQIFFGLILLSFYHPFFIFFGLVLIVILALIFRITYPSGLKTSLKESKHKYEVAFWLEEIARTLHTFKLAGKSQLPLDKTDALVSDYLDAKEKHFKILLAQYFSIVSFKTLITFVLLALGGYLVIQNQINIGQFVAAELIIILVLGASEKLITTMETVYDVLTALDKIGGITDLPLEENTGLEADVLSSAQGLHVELKNLSYKFLDALKPTLKNIDLNIKAGEKIALVGYNGSGKTTLVQIISCFLNDYEGSITFNGISRRNFNQRSIRSLIGDYSAQEDIFRGTLEENISLAYKHIEFEDIRAVAESVGLLPFVATLPKGFNTLLLPGGKNLPRHIVAKIILARSVVSKPKLLAIEELMANLERKDRTQIAELLTKKESLWTLVAVTDDPLLAAKCDRVLVMKAGEIVASGHFSDIQKTEHYPNIFKVNT
jgi:ABC-type bacteriocin/lantibiotic exporter with double-glycine peptidase domain